MQSTEGRAAAAASGSVSAVYSIALGTEVPEERDGLSGASTLEAAKIRARYGHEWDNEPRVVYRVSDGHVYLRLKPEKDFSPPRYQVMPSMTEDEYEALKADIAKNGVAYPIIRDSDNRTIDGHHRERAWKELEAEGHPITEEMYLPVEHWHVGSVQEGRDIAWRLNMLRRKMSLDQKRTRIKTKLKESPEYSNAQIARLMGVSDHTVGTVREELEEARVIDRYKPEKGGRGRTTRTEKDDKPRNCEVSGADPPDETGPADPEGKPEPDKAPAPEAQPTTTSTQEAEAEATDALPASEESSTQEDSQNGQFNAIEQASAMLDDLWGTLLGLDARELAAYRSAKFKGDERESEKASAERVADFLTRYLQEL